MPAHAQDLKGCAGLARTRPRGAGGRRSRRPQAERRRDRTAARTHRQTGEIPRRSPFAPRICAAHTHLRRRNDTGHSNRHPAGPLRRSHPRRCRRLAAGAASPRERGSARRPARHRPRLTRRPARDSLLVREPRPDHDHPQTRLRSLRNGAPAPRAEPVRRDRRSGESRGPRWPHTRGNAVPRRSGRIPRLVRQRRGIGAPRRALNALRRRPAGSSRSGTGCRAARGTSRISTGRSRTCASRACTSP